MLYDVIHAGSLIVVVILFYQLLADTSLQSVRLLGVHGWSLLTLHDTQLATVSYRTQKQKSTRRCVVGSCTYVYDVSGQHFDNRRVDALYV